MDALLISTYELGRQPFGLASPAAWLRAAGWDVTCVDVTKERIGREAIERAALVGFHLQMHTATRLAAPIIEGVRRMNQSARICAYGLYAPLNADWLRSIGVDAIFGGEFEEELTRYAASPAAPDATSTKSEEASRGTVSRVPRLKFLVPDRSGLPPLDRYAVLHLGDGRTRIVGATETSRGCRHLCRHCPIVPVYNGQFRIVQPEVVLADVDAQVAAGAAHITFGDPDFFNGPSHAMRIVESLHRAHPELSYDVTIKIEHLLRHRDLLPRLVETGCAFVTSAVESIDDRVLALLDKGHTRQDFADAVSICRSVGLTLVPTFVAFHPWLALDDYAALVDTIESLDLVQHVAPIQLTIRLLIPQGSRLLELPEVRGEIGAYDRSTLAFPWRHRDPRVDDLQRTVAHLVGTRLTADRGALFDEISALAHARAGTVRPRTPAVRAERRPVPYLSEPWYCCAEPNPDHLTLV